MNAHHVTLRLNQQQLELIDRTVGQGIAASRAELVHLALKQYAEMHQNDSSADKPSYAGALK
jgi:Arc/MetJ-type ribon-helix-helix transcriptional regulator